MDGKVFSRRLRLSCILLFFLCLGAFCLSAEETPKQGKHKTFYANGKVRTVSWYKKGSLVRRKVFYNDGALLRDEVWNNNLMALKREYTPEGRVSAVWDYKTRTITLYNEDESPKRTVPLKLQVPWERTD